MHGNKQSPADEWRTRSCLQEPPDARAPHAGGAAEQQLLAPQPPAMLVPVYGGYPMQGMAYPMGGPVPPGAYLRYQPLPQGAAPPPAPFMGLPGMYPQPHQPPPAHHHRQYQNHHQPPPLQHRSQPTTPTAGPA